MRARIKSCVKRKAPLLGRKGRFPNPFAFVSKLTVLKRPENHRNRGAPKILRFVRFAWNFACLPTWTQGTLRNCKKRDWLISSKNTYLLFFPRYFDCIFITLPKMAVFWKAKMTKFSLQKNFSSNCLLWTAVQWARAWEPTTSMTTSAPSRGRTSSLCPPCSSGPRSAHPPSRCPPTTPPQVPVATYPSHSVQWINTFLQCCGSASRWCKYGSDLTLW